MRSTWPQACTLNAFCFVIGVAAQDRSGYLQKGLFKKHEDLIVDRSRHTYTVPLGGYLDEPLGAFRTMPTRGLTQNDEARSGTAFFDFFLYCSRSSAPACLPLARL